MSPIRPSRQRPRPRLRLQVEPLEARSLLSSTLGLTPLVQVSGDSPLPPPASSPRVDVNSEVEPQLAVDPTNPAHAVALWQQDRYFSGGGARALVASVSYDANNPAGAHWSTPAAIPWFDATNPNNPEGFARYTDPWVSVAPDGTVYAAALALTTSGPFPGHTAVLVSKSIDGGLTWGAPSTLIDTQAPPGTDPANLANDKEMIVADPRDATGRTAYVAWDQLDFPGGNADFDAFHATAAIRENAFFSKTTDGGAHWTPALNLTNFKDLQAASGNQLVVEPDGTLVDVCTLFKGSGNQPPQAGKITLAVLRSTDGGATWSAPVVGPAVEAMDVTDPDTGAPVRDGESIAGVSGDPANGNLYAVWADGRFSNFSHEDVAFSMSTNGGLTWSAPIKVNQTPTNIPAGDQQAFTPAVAVNSAGTVAVTYYDFRNNVDLTPGSGLPTDYWLAHAGGDFTNPASWAADEKRLTDTSFNMEGAPPTSRGVFLGDYEGLAGAGTSFYALFAQAGRSTSDPSNVFFRDPPPAPEAAAAPQGGGEAIAAHVAASSPHPFAPDGLPGELASLLGATSGTAGQGHVPEADGRRAQDVHPGGGPEGRQGAVLSPGSDLDLAFPSASAGGSSSLDRLFADGEDALFPEAPGSDGTPVDGPP
jgi:hypothetical protein